MIAQASIIIAAVVGLASAYVAVTKLRPDIDSAAVTQSQGAMEVMQKLNDELEAALNRCRAENSALVADRDYHRTQHYVLREVLRSAGIDAPEPGSPPAT